METIWLVLDSRGSPLCQVVCLVCQKILNHMRKHDMFFLKIKPGAGCWLLTPVILSQGLLFKANSGK
jgi:hypothetical protein